MPETLSTTLQKAWDRRSALRGRTQAFRLLNGAASGLPGLAVDLFAGHPVVYAYDKLPDARKTELAEALRAVTGAPGAALIDRSAADESGRVAGKPGKPVKAGKAGESGGVGAEAGAVLYGEVPERVTAEESLPAGTAVPEGGLAGPLRFTLHLRHPRNVGLFLDTRPLRDRLRATSSGAAVLNLFAYSCSLGAAAAAGGAASTANVDISARYLGWGKENFRQTGIPEGAAKFTRMDGEEYLDWAARKGHAYGIVILDPPSFSRADGKTFGFEKDYFRLLSKAAARLAPGGRIYAVTNFGGITAARFREGAAAAVAEAGRAVALLAAVPQAEDFDPAPDGSSRALAREGAFLALEIRVR